MKKAIILAAGAGQRLGELTSDIPKCLLKADSKNCLIDFSLESLKEINIKEIIFVTGHKEERLKEHINKKWSDQFIFRFIFNEKFKEYNNIYSAYLARNIWDDETILLNSDIIFHQDILKNLALSSQLSALSSFLIIDNKKELISEDMKVKIDSSSKIIEINKNLDIATSYGEYIGITYLRGIERVKFLESVELNIKNNNFDLYYEDALAQVLNEVSISPCSTEGNIWTEVDTLEDFEMAKNISSQIKKLALL
ncbi:MAG: phosphocholine cytidylyltransferase family protein [Candidatus Melainabacteria bacterium]|nr:phosphocholine cytidylyltransferase family protein [Candidatus Melainabacteria bacterium]